MTVEEPMPMTDRRIRSAEDLADLDFEKGSGLIPVVAQDAESGAVLMVGWVNRDALIRTLETDFVHFWSRSRNELWKKGATSGNIFAVDSLHTDCDADTVLALVRPRGPACHTGDRTCFGEGSTVDTPSDTLSRLDATLADRADERPEGSYTVQLLDDVNLRMKKLGEETAELVAALATGDGKRAQEEVADLLYHALVALRAEGIGLDAVLAALEARSR